MNPVLLKPEGGGGGQLVLQGRMAGRIEAGRPAESAPDLLPVILESFGQLESEADLVLIEGAGSPAEINLRSRDIANMGFAEAAGVPVALIGDIDRGGVIAALIGTMAVLPEADRRHIKGFLVNKFRARWRSSATASA